MKLFTFALFLLTVASYTQIGLSRTIESRIIGGQVARAGEFPSAAAINIHTNDGQYFCGGSLISDQYVLTAAQCCDGALRFSIILGANNIQQNPPSKITVAAEEYFLNPDYDAFTLRHDIAIIKLRMPVEFNEYVQPIQLPSEALPDYATVVAIGWGQISDSDGSRTSDLYRATITAFPNEECRLTFGTAIIDEMVCAEGNFNQGTCEGDSGSPLIRYVLNQEPTHVAVSSFFSGNGCESTDPSGFTRTFPYLDWIKSVADIV